MVRMAAWLKGGRSMALLGGLGVAACATPQQIVAQREDALTAAGFLFRPANTPDRIAMLQRLPPNRFLRRVQGNDVSYIYADPLVCNCLYVGSEQAYGTYRRDRLQQRLASEQLLAAQTYQDAAWNWGPWGYSRFGFGPGW